MKVKIAEQDIIYLSYDEPNADKNYADLLTKVPWAKRVHGVEGSDAAHKACAELSETDRFITVDGDNTIRQDFINQVLDFDEHTDLEHSVISWCGKNSVNGLLYGNGGLKCWPKQYVLDMKTHENADPNNKQAQVDFCWDLQYIQQNSCYSDVYNNETPHQAWRAGFREGVKMALDQGVKPTKEEFLNGHWKNLHRLWIWLMVGADAKNGNWAILGAREGLSMTMLSDWDYVQVRDFEYLNQLWGGRDEMPADVLHDEIFNYGSDLINQLDCPIAIQPFTEEQSQFFKTVYQNPSRNSNQQFIDKEK
jgi:hypothetical protein